MFGIDFTELAVIFAVALVVLGPKRLPGLVRKIGRWVGKARSMARQFREQLENEIDLDELNKMTEMRASEARSNPPPPPPAESGYPYGPPPPEGEPPTDDTHSHAHAPGETPAPWEPEPAEPAPAAADPAADTK